jgi:cytochrome b6-f complex iron-sulfur subunit
MATKDLVTKVWIAPGCIVCDACETTCPEVFDVRHDDGTCLIRPEALNAEFTKKLTDTIIEAAEECPVDVIKFETIAAEVPDSEVATPAKAKAGVAAGGGADDSGKPRPGPRARRHDDKPKITDPAIQSLLDAAMARGGKASMENPAFAADAALNRLKALPPDQLPPDARQQKSMAAAKTAAKDPDGGSSRRDVVLLGAWGVFGLGVLGPSTHLFARFMMPNVLEEPDPRVRIGALDKFREMKPGDVNEDYKNSGKFWIIRTENRISAVSIICTHLGCVPSWLPNDRKFKCPCHGSGFKPDGTNFEGPAPRPLERFKILMDGDTVIVDRSKKFLAMGPNDTAVWTDPEAFIVV